MSEGTKGVSVEKDLFADIARQLAFARTSIERTYNFIRPVRSDLWAAIYGASGAPGLTQYDIDSIVWSVSLNQ